MAFHHIVRSLLMSPRKMNGTPQEMNPRPQSPPPQTKASRGTPDPAPTQTRLERNVRTSTLFS